MDHKNFYVHLSSVDSLAFFPHNTSHNFSNVLSSSIDLSDGAYEVGLASIIYEEKNVQSMKRKLYLPDQSRILIDYPSRSVFNKNVGLADWYLGEENFVTTMNDVLKKLRYAHLEYFEDTENNKKVKLFVYLTYEGKITLDSNLSTILGLSKTDFTNGEHTGQQAISLEMLRTPRNPLIVAITLVKMINVFATISKPYDDSLDAVAEAINTAFEEKEIDIIASIDRNEEFLKFKFADEMLSILLPLSLSLYFGSNPEKKYSEKNPSIDLQALKVDVKNNQVLCLSNIVKEQHYGNTMFPILRILPSVSTIKGSVALNFHPLFYVPVTVKQLDKIQIQFVTTNTFEVPIDSIPVILSLHFRRIS